jgi:hypothetical protein
MPQARKSNTIIFRAVRIPSENSRNTDSISRHQKHLVVREFGIPKHQFSRLRFELERRHRHVYSARAGIHFLRRRVHVSRLAGHFLNPGVQILRLTIYGFNAAASRNEIGTAEHRCAVKFNFGRRFFYTIPCKFPPCVSTKNPPPCRCADSAREVAAHREARVLCESLLKALRRKIR